MSATAMPHDADLDELVDLWVAIVERYGGSEPEEAWDERALDEWLTEMGSRGLTGDEAVVRLEQVVAEIAAIRDRHGLNPN